MIIISLMISSNCTLSFYTHRVGIINTFEAEGRMLEAPSLISTNDNARNRLTNPAAATKFPTPSGPGAVRKWLVYGREDSVGTTGNRGYKLKDLLARELLNSSQKYPILNEWVKKVAANPHPTPQGSPVSTWIWSMQFLSHLIICDKEIGIM